MLNKLFRANIRWQALAEPFLNYCDGVHTPLFEEFPDRRRRRSAPTSAERQADVRRPELPPRLPPRLGRHAASGSSIAIWPTCGSSRRPSPARQANRSTSWPRPPAASRSSSSWTCWPSTIRRSAGRPSSRTIGPTPRQFLFAHDTTLPGFNDSGAHARNMAFQDGGLQMLQQVLLNPQLDADREGDPQADRPIGRMAGDRRRLAAPRRAADVVVIDPEKLRSGLGAADRAITIRGCTARCGW